MVQTDAIGVTTDATKNDIKTPEVWSFKNPFLAFIVGLSLGAAFVYIVKSV